MSANTPAITFGVGIPQGWRMDLVEISDPVEKYEAMTHAAQEADRLGYDSLWLYDHFHTVPRPELETTFECWTITAGLARDTQRIRLGQMATCNGYRNPALLAKMASTVDVMSHGRLIVGLGAGWYEHEYRAYGYGYPDTRERMGRFREACEIVHRMWTEDYPEFHGRYYTIDRPINEPKGVQKPHPPLWVAGSGEQVTLKLVAQWGDGCNVFGSDPQTVRHKLDVLRQHCDALGRDYETIARSCSVGLHMVESEATAERETALARGPRSYEEYKRITRVGTADQIAAQLEELIAAGARYFIVYLPRLAYDLTQLQRFALEVMPRFQSPQPG
jgi:F420-dependent oxidoreductase-like protein